MTDLRFLIKRTARLASFSSTMVLLAATSAAQGDEVFDFQEQPDPANVVHAAKLVDGDVVHYSNTSLLDSSFLTRLDPLAGDEAITKAQATRTFQAFSEAGRAGKAPSGASGQDDVARLVDRGTTTGHRDGCRHVRERSADAALSGARSRPEVRIGIQSRRIEQGRGDRRRGQPCQVRGTGRADRGAKRLA